jgi:hypothetical protein
LAFAELIAAGTDPNLLHEANRIKVYSELDETSSNEDKLTVIKNYYVDRKFKPKEIERTINDIELEELNIDDVLKEATDHFSDKYQSIIEDQQTAALERNRVAEETKTRLRQTIDSLVESGEVLGVPIPDKKDFKRAIYTKDKIVNIQNQDYQVSDLDIFHYEMDNNPEVFMSSFLQWLYKDKIADKVSEKAKEKVEEDFLSGYRKSVEKSQKRLKKQKLDQKIKNQPEGRRKTLILDGRGSLL